MLCAAYSNIMILTTGIAQKLEISHNLEMQANFSAYSDLYSLKKNQKTWCMFQLTYQWHIFNIWWSAWGKTFTHFLFKNIYPNCGSR